MLDRSTRAGGARRSRRLPPALLLAGCSMMPTYERPAAPVAATFPRRRCRSRRRRSPPTSTGRTSSATRGCAADRPSRWRNNRDLRVAVLNIEQARAQYDIRRADQLPTVGAGVTGLRQPGASGSSTTRLHRRAADHRLARSTSSAASRSLSEAALAQYLASEEGAQDGADQPGRRGRANA